MCDFCERARVILDTDVVDLAMLQWTGCTPEDAHTFEYSLGVFIDRGYLRLVDKDDCDCLDHGARIKISYCPMCGSNL